MNRSEMTAWRAYPRTAKGDAKPSGTSATTSPLAAATPPANFRRFAMRRSRVPAASRTWGADGRQHRRRTPEPCQLTQAAVNRPPCLARGACPARRAVPTHARPPTTSSIAPAPAVQSVAASSRPEPCKPQGSAHRARTSPGLAAHRQQLRLQRSGFGRRRYRLGFGVVGARIVTMLSH
jgi:hypothetical protein